MTGRILKCYIQISKTSQTSNSNRINLITLTNLATGQILQLNTRDNHQKKLGTTPTRKAPESNHKAYL